MRYSGGATRADDVTSNPSNDAFSLGETGILSGLSPAQQAEVLGRLDLICIQRGEMLVRQGDPAVALYLVVSGRFAVSKDGRHSTIAEIGPGQPIGEIAFLAGGVRTASVRAIRDSLVLRLSRDDFDALTAKDPGIWRALAIALADRLRSTTAAQAPPPDPRPRTIAIIRAGQSDVPETFLVRFAEVLARHGSHTILRAGAESRIEGLAGDVESAQATRALNDLEARYDYVVFIADAELSPWTQKAIRHADLILSVGRHGADAMPNDIERHAATVVAPEARRLVLIHDTCTKVKGTRRWLEGRNLAMHHHVALDDIETVERLYRFISGTAKGLVACGGGALCATHVGVFKALREAGHSFDIMGGTSAGSAMTAAFLLRSEPDEIIQSIHDMFVTNRAMRRYTLPRYSLLDHGNFDTQLRRLFGNVDIEDLWLPYFAVSTNLSTYTLHVHRSGDLWTAVRASGSIPVLLPPIYTGDGQMLVDGGLIDNVPIRQMHEMKSGPNVVVSFLVPEMQRFDVDYANLPQRAELIRKTILPFAASGLPPAPSLVTVLMRALLANRDDFQRFLTAEDQLLVPPIPADIGFLDWHRHRELYEFGYNWAKAALRKTAAP